MKVALRKESVDRNGEYLVVQPVADVALRKESVDRNFAEYAGARLRVASLSARRAWIEIVYFSTSRHVKQRRSPQGERG